jgi:hypothetical protein
MQLHNDTFHPYTLTADGRCVIAGEDEWERIEAAATAGKRILVSDVFAEWDGWILDCDGKQVHQCVSKWPMPAPFRGTTAITTAEVRRRMFALFDRTPATWCIETRHPENVLTMIPDGYWQKLPCPKHSKRFQLECPACNGKNAERVDKQRPNVHLYAGPIHTQADADAMVPALLRCPAAVRGLVVTPREEISLVEYLGIQTWIGPLTSKKHYEWSHRHNQGLERRPDHVIIRGDDKPMHPAHVRGIIEQCEAAGVPVWFDGWGEWLPECEPSPMGILGTMDYGYPIHEWKEDGGWYSHRVGRAASGSMLDGNEWRQLPEVPA